MRKFARSILPGLLGLGLIFGVKSAYAAQGSLDSTFGKGGIVETNLGISLIALDAALQPDGKILVEGNFGVVRYLSSGALDTNFGSKGLAQPPIPFNGPSGSVAVQADGKIVVAGAVETSNVDEFAVARFNPNGSVDTSFGSGGEVTTSLGFPGVGEAVLIQPDGRILLGAQLEPVGRHQPFKTALARYHPNGGLDATFGNQGTVSVVAVGGCTTLALLSDGEILVVNSSAIAQFTSTGGLEPTVKGGTIVAKTANIFQPDGKYIHAQVFVVGTPRNNDDDAQVLRFTANGGVDSTFANPAFDFVGEGGSANRDLPTGAALEANGQIVVVGSHSHEFENTLNAVARLNSDGSFDSTFGSSGIVTNNLPAGAQGFLRVLIQADGKILAIGTANTSNDPSVPDNLTIERFLSR